MFDWPVLLLVRFVPHSWCAFSSKELMVIAFIFLGGMDVIFGLWMSFQTHNNWFFQTHNNWFPVYVLIFLGEWYHVWISFNFVQNHVHFIVDLKSNTSSFRFCMSQIWVPVDVEPNRLWVNLHVLQLLKLSLVNNPQKYARFLWDTQHLFSWLASHLG